MEDPDKKPKRVPKKRPPSTKKQPKLPVDKVDNKKPSSPPPLPIPESCSLTSLSGLKMVMSMCESPASKKRRVSTEAVGGQLQEHLSSFILIGYTLDGLPVNITYATSPQEYDSLSTGLQRYIIHTGDGGF
jgi:hypothetical protein